MFNWVLRLFLLPIYLVWEVWRRLGGTGQSSTPLYQAPYRGGPIAVIALFQQSRVRADVLGLVLALRRQGVYVIAVNTGQLDDQGARFPVDCYVERRNYGRDFGSYRRGIRLVQQLAPDVPRLLLLNDSVFYSSKGLADFLSRLTTSSSDICSATESREVAEHQTSFCLSFSRSCVADPAFFGFWNRYKPTDLRPATVILGEIALSRTLTRKGFTKSVLASHDSVSGWMSDVPCNVSVRRGWSRKPKPVSYVDWCLAGNISHRAPAALLDLGVPLVKLDLVHRAGLDDSGLRGLQTRMAPHDYELLDELLHQKSQTARTRGALEQLGTLCGLS